MASVQIYVDKKVKEKIKELLEECEKYQHHIIKFEKEVANLQKENSLLKEHLRLVIENKK